MIISQTNIHTHDPEELQKAVSVNLYDEIVQKYLKT